MAHLESLKLSLQNLKEFNILKHKKLIESLALPSYKIIAIPRSENSLHKSRYKGKILSKIGGNPDLPKEFTWPSEDNELLSFFTQINLEDLPEIPKLPSNISLPKSGLISIFIPLTTSDNYQDVELKDYMHCYPKIYFFEDLTKLRSTEIPSELTQSKTIKTKEYIKIGEVPNPNYSSDNVGHNRPDIKPDESGSFELYFSNLFNFAGNSIKNNKSSVQPILKEIIVDKVLSSELFFDEIFLNFEVFASFPIDQSSSFLENKLTEIEIENYEKWCNLWWDKNYFSGSNLLGYPHSCQVIDLEYSKKSMVNYLGLGINDFKKSSVLYHLVSFGDDFESILTYYGLCPTNNFYMLQENNILDLKFPVLEANSD